MTSLKENNGKSSQTDKQCFDDLLKEKQLFESLYTNIPVALAIADSKSIVQRVNKAFTDIFQYSDDEIVGKNVDELLSTEATKKEAFSITKSVCGGEMVNIETRRKRKDGTVIDVSIMAIPINIGKDQVLSYGVYRDISEQKSTREEIRKQQDLVQNIFESSPDAITVTDLRGRIIMCNDAVLKMHNLPADFQYIGKNAIEFFAPEIRKEMIRTFQVIKEKGSVRNLEYVLIKSDGTKFPVELNAKVLNDSNGNPIGTVSVTKDINERKKYVEELKKAKDKAEEADNLKTAFLTSMSHEIRTPMNHIMGFIELLDNPDFTKEERQEYIRIISNSGITLLRLIDDIIDVAKIEAGQMNVNKTVSFLDRIISEVQKFSREERERIEAESIEIRYVPPKHERNREIITDPILLQQILINLVSNALKFTDAGSVELGYRVNEKENNIEFYVRDTGIGIPKHMQELIFQRFRQLDYGAARKRGGTGLGLTITKGLINLLGGKIWLESDPGKGTVFYFNLPDCLVVKEKKQPEKASTSDEYPDWSDKVIMMVEDDETSIQVVQAFLRKTKVKFLIANNGHMAIELCKTRPEIDLVLMDIRMPKLDGYDATGAVKKIRKDLPVVVQTAHTTVEEKQKAFDSGCDDFIAKPILRKPLIQILKKYIKSG